MSAAISFLFGPVGRWLLIALAFFAWTAYQRDQAADEARENCRAEQLERTVEELQRQRDAAQQALEAAEAQAERTAREMEQLEMDRDQIWQDLQNAADTCDIPDSATDRLHDIR